MRANSRPALFLPLLAAMVAGAWLCLWLWDGSPYARYLRHAAWSDIGLAGYLCGALPGGATLFPAFLHVMAWQVMIVAMMLPTTAPLLETFRRLTSARPDRDRLVALVLLGYIGVWALFGVAAHGLDWALQQLVWRNSWLTFHGWLISAGVLCLAGAYQFSPLKYRCLDKCRSPLMFVSEHWRGSNAGRESLMLGAHHGAFCVGCCWALMLLMFAVGGGSVGWMLALGAVMVIEKNLPWGRRLAKPVGMGLFLWAAAIMAQNL